MTGIFGGAPKPPAPPDPVAMPDINDPAILAFRRRAIDAQRGASGRDSTVLSTQQGTGTYTSNKLGVS